MDLHLRRVHCCFYRVTLCVSAVFAVAPCLSVRLSRWCIVSRRLKIFFADPVAPSLWFSDPQRRYPIPRGTPSAGHKIQGVWIFFCDFRLKSLSISETVRDRPMVNCYETLVASHTRSIEWWHFQWPWRTLTRLSRLRHFWSRISQKWDQNVPLSMTLIDPWPGSQGRDIFHIEYLRNDTR